MMPFDDPGPPFIATRRWAEFHAHCWTTAGYNSWLGGWIARGGLASCFRAIWDRLRDHMRAAFQSHATLGSRVWVRGERLARAVMLCCALHRRRRGEKLPNERGGGVEVWLRAWRQRRRQWRARHDFSGEPLPSYPDTACKGCVTPHVQ